jgi:hypothetical protein
MDPLMVRMERVALPDEPGPHTVLLGEGTLPSGRHIVFGGERAQMLLVAEGIAMAAQIPGSVPVYVLIEDWQIVRGGSPHRCSCGHSLDAHAEPSGKREPYGGCALCHCREAWVVESDEPADLMRQCLHCDQRTGNLNRVCDGCYQNPERWQR